MLKKVIEYSFVLLLISIITFLFTFPLFLNFKSTIYGISEFHSDPFGVIWWTWYQRHYSNSIFSPTFIDLVNHPFGIDYANQPHQPLLDFLLRFLGIFFDEVVTYNLLIICGFIITGIIAYSFFRYLFKNKLAGLFSAILFSFSVDHLMHSMQHLGFALLWWIPLLGLCIFRLRDKPNFIFGIITGLFISATILTNYYYGYFILLFLFYFILWFILPFLVRGQVDINFLKSILLLLGVGCIVSLFFIKGIIIGFSIQGMGGRNIIQPFRDLFKYSAHWWDYFLPSEFHPLFGKFTKKVVNGFGGRHYFERSLYLGYIPLLLSVVAIIKTRFGKKNPIVGFFFISTVMFFIFSLKPVFQLGNFRIPNISFFMYEILPMFRVYARIGILAILSISVLSGFGLTYIIEKTKSRGRKSMLVTICILGVLFEYINFPPFHSIDLSIIPEIYKWLAKQDKDVVVVEYPFVRSIEAVHSDYLINQRVHKKKLVNGAPDGSLGDAFRRQCKHPSTLETAKLLAYLGTDYVIIHEDAYSKEVLEEIGKNPGLEFIKSFSNTRIYRIIAQPYDLTTVFWQSFAGLELWDDGKYWRWMGNNASIWIGLKEREIVDIKFKILAFAKTRELEIYINDILIKKLLVDASSSPGFAQDIILKGILLQSGGNIIKFYTPQGETRIGDVLRNEDNRKVSFAISEFRITPIN